MQKKFDIQKKKEENVFSMSNSLENQRVIQWPIEFPCTVEVVDLQSKTHRLLKPLFMVVTQKNATSAVERATFERFMKQADPLKYYVARLGGGMAGFDIAEGDVGTMTENSVLGIQGAINDRLERLIAEFECMEENKESLAGLALLFRGKLSVYMEAIPFDEIK